MKNKFTLFLGALSIISIVGTTTLNAKPQQQKAQMKPFLIQGKLPHLTMMLKILWDDKDLALTPKQKEQLLKIRKETIVGAKALSKQIQKLENKVVQASNNGAKPASLKENLEKIAALRVEASMLHLNCIYNTKNILTQEQLYIIE
jgi:Spy/CpxP family protein refolding chaperone